MLNNDSVVSDCLKVSLLAAYKFDVTLSPALVTSYVIYEQVFLKVFIWFDSVEWAAGMYVWLSEILFLLYYAYLRIML